MPDPMMAMMFAMRNVIPFTTITSLKERSAAPMQEALKTGDCGFQMRDDGLYDDPLTVVEILDPVNVTPDWQERVSRGYFYCRWHSVENPEGDFGWFARIFTLPLSKATYNTIVAEMHQMNGHAEKGYFDSSAYPEMDRTYREWSSQEAEKEEKISPVKCESCFSVQVEVKVDHISHVRGSAMWNTLDSGEIKLVPVSKVSDCENIASMTCLDCGWTREIEESELMLSHGG